MGGDSNSGGTAKTGGQASGGKIGLPPSSGGNGPGSGGASGGTAPGWLATCELESGSSVGDPQKDLVIDNFDDGVKGFYGNGLQGGWYAFVDPSGGLQDPTGSDIAAAPGGITEPGFALHITGSGQTEWGSGLGAIFASRSIGQECLFDASAYDGVTFWMRGSMETEGSVEASREGVVRFKVHEKDDQPTTVGGNCPGNCFDAHGANLVVDTCWQQYTFRFADLKQEGWGYPGGELDLHALHTLEFGMAQGQKYDLWLDNVSFFVGNVAPAEPICEGTGGMGGMGGMGGGSP
jgi:Carbohydrate binding domain (family 11)